MILTVTINPLLETRLAYHEVIPGANHRNVLQKFAVGGKGINVSRQLLKLGVSNLAFTFLGGNNGKKIANLLKEEKIDFTMIHTKSETRFASVIIDQSRQQVTTFFGENSFIEENESIEFKNKLEKIIQNCEIVVFAGSSPCLNTDDIFRFGIETANKYDKVSVLDTYGKHLEECLEAAPTIVHNNVVEVKNSLGIALENEQDKIEYMNRLYKKGIKQVYLTNADKPAYVSNFDFHYKVIIPRINSVDSTGSGDAFVAGLVYGWYNDNMFEETLKFSCGLGVANSLSIDVCAVTKNDAESCAEKIKIEPIGKKMILLDVTPQK